MVLINSLTLMLAFIKSVVLVPCYSTFIDDIFHIFYDNSSGCFPVTLGKQKLNCLMYADDLFILSETEQGLISSLHKLKRYLDTWGLKSLYFILAQVWEFHNCNRVPFEI